MQKSNVICIVRRGRAEPRKHRGFELGFWRGFLYRAFYCALLKEWLPFLPALNAPFEDTVADLLLFAIPISGFLIVAAVAFDSWLNGGRLSARLAKKFAESPSRRMTRGELLTLRHCVVAEYAAYIEKSPVASGQEIRDTAHLPYPKPAIRDALLAELADAPNTGRADALVVLLLALPDFQDGVGSESLWALGCDVVALRDLGLDARALAEKIVTNPTRQRYEQFAATVEAEEAALYPLLGRAPRRI